MNVHGVERVTGMIESKQQLLDNFLKAAEVYLAEPTLVNGIDLDDATVTLKRYVLSELKDQPTASELGRIPQLIRQSGVDAIDALVAEIKWKLSG